MKKTFAIQAILIGVFALALSSCGRPNHAQETKNETAEVLAGFETLGKLPRKADKRVKEVYYDTWDAAKDADKHAAAVLRQQEREFAQDENREAGVDKEAKEEAERKEAQRELDTRTRLQKIFPGGEGPPEVKKTLIRRKYVVVDR